MALTSVHSGRTSMRRTTTSKHSVSPGHVLEFSPLPSTLIVWYLSTQRHNCPKLSKNKTAVTQFCCVVPAWMQHIFRSQQQLTVSGTGNTRLRLLVHIHWNNFTDVAVFVHLALKGRPLCCCYSSIYIHYIPVMMSPSRPKYLTPRLWLSARKITVASEIKLNLLAHA